VFLIGFVQAYPKLANFIWLELVLFFVLGAASVPLNLRTARKYRQRIDALDAVAKPN
jgi:hypothetical protein